MRHEKHTQSSSIPGALALPDNAVAVEDADPMSVNLNSHLMPKLEPYWPPKTFTTLLYT